LQLQSQSTNRKLVLFLIHLIALLPLSLSLLLLYFYYFPLSSLHLPFPNKQLQPFNHNSIYQINSHPQVTQIVTMPSVWNYDSDVELLLTIIEVGDKSILWDKIAGKMQAKGFTFTKEACRYVDRSIFLHIILAHCCTIHLFPCLLIWNSVVLFAAWASFEICHVCVFTFLFHDLDLILLVSVKCQLLFMSSDLLVYITIGLSYTTLSFLVRFSRSCFYRWFPVSLTCFPVSLARFPTVIPLHHNLSTIHVPTIPIPSSTYHYFLSPLPLLFTPLIFTHLTHPFHLHLSIPPPSSHHSSLSTTTN
jgi:hypothetical protein